jgi:predicted aspartyl protease
VGAVYKRIIAVLRGARRGHDTAIGEPVRLQLVTDRFAAVGCTPMRHVAYALTVVLFVSITARAETGVPPAAVVATLPFLASDEPNRIIVDLGPEGRPLKLMLDTGASHSVFTPLAARAAGVSVRALKNTPYRHATRVGRDLQFWVDTSTSDTGSRTGWEYGLLGASFLQDFVVELDFASRVVRLLDPQRFEVTEAMAVDGAVVMPIRAGGGRPVLDVAVGAGTIPAMLDTGAPWPAVLSGKAAKKVGIDVDALLPFGTMGTTLGPMPVRLHEAADFAIGTFHFANVPVLVAPKGWYNLAGEASDSVIGYDLLSRFLVRIDYPRGRLWLQRRSERVPYLGLDYQSTRAVGVFIQPSARDFYVTGVLPDTPASRLGIRPGDTLLDESPGDAQRRTLEEVLAAIRDGKPVRVARKLNETWIDIDLPDDPALDSQAAPGDGDD